MANKAHKDMNSLAKSYEPDVKTMNQQILAEELSDIKRQAQSILTSINALWQGYEVSYAPQVYPATGKTSRGFDISDGTAELNPDGSVTIEIDLILKDENMWHDSLFGGKQGHSFMLISEGWKWQNNYDGSRYRFSEFDGVGIVDTLIREQNNSKYEFIFYFEGEEYGGKRDRGSFSFTR